MNAISILHCHSTFSLGGKEARAVRLMNVFGDSARHTILSAVPDALGAREAIDPAVKVDFPGERAPPLYGKPSPGRYRDLTRYMRQFDLVLTYNWGSMDAVGARRLFPKGMPPLIHHEDGFNADEIVKLNWKRNAFRKLMLPTAQHVVVPSQRLATIAGAYWGRADVVRIPNGIPTALYTKPPIAEAFPGFVRASSDVIIGTLAGLRGVKNLPRLVRAIAPLPDHVKLVIVGEGPERDAIMAEAARLNVAHRVHLAGFMRDPHRFVGHFDIFALSSDSEQFPISLVEAMAAGKPAVSTEVGDVMAIVAPENRRYVIPKGDEIAFSEAFKTLIDDAALRQSIGAANQRLAQNEYEEADMIAAYRKLYWDAVK
jgi:L-malate glycosyltransferase